MPHKTPPFTLGTVTNTKNIVLAWFQGFCSLSGTETQMIKQAEIRSQSTNFVSLTLIYTLQTDQWSFGG